MIEDWDDILQEAGFKAGYKKASKEILEDLADIYKSRTTVLSMLAILHEKREKWERIKNE